MSVDYREWILQFMDRESERADAIKQLMFMALCWYNNYYKESDRKLDTRLENACQAFEEAFGESAISEFMLDIAEKYEEI